jgi:GDP-D-mannose dehydratase
MGDASLARNRLGWAPSVDFEELVRILVEAELAALTVAETELLPLE